MLHEILTERRRSIGMSIDQLVEKSGIPKGTVTKVLTGVSPNPALETVRSIAYALGLTLNDLVEGTTPDLTPEALAVARAYDKLSDYSKAIIDCVIAQDDKRKADDSKKAKPGHYVVKVVPTVEEMFGIKTAHDSDLQARYNSRKEIEELQAEMALEMEEKE